MHFHQIAQLQDGTSVSPTWGRVWYLPCIISASFSLTDVTSDLLDRNEFIIYFLNLYVHFCYIKLPRDNVVVPDTNNKKKLASRAVPYEPKVELLVHIFFFGGGEGTYYGVSVRMVPLCKGQTFRRDLIRRSSFRMSLRHFPWKDNTKSHSL